MGIKFSDISVLNKRYVSEINVHENEPNAYRGIMDNTHLFIERILRHGNFISLNDIDYSISENTFWDIEFFEDYCQNLFFTFKKGFVLKLIRRIGLLERSDISYFFITLSSNLIPYQHVFSPGATSYQTFIGRKLKSLNEAGALEEAQRLDKENRNRLLEALQEELKIDKSAQTSPSEYPEEDYDQLPFTKMLRPKENSRFKTKQIIGDYLLQAGIPFALFSQKPVQRTGKNHNPDGFNGAVAAMIHIFKELNYFEQGLTFPFILDAYLKESGNKIGKLGYFKRHYMDDDYFIQYQNKLRDILPKKL